MMSYNDVPSSNQVLELRCVLVLGCSTFPKDLGLCDVS